MRQLNLDAEQSQPAAQENLRDYRGRSARNTALPRRGNGATGLVRLATLACLFGASPAGAQNVGGGPPPEPSGQCISPVERLRIEKNVARTMALLNSSTVAGQPTPYPFMPMAGNVWGDRFINNYVDLDPTAGLRDWDCTDWTYNGHAGYDIDLRSFGEQDAGVPVFAALDGTVVDAHDGEADRNTAMNNQPANYVILYHGGTHYTWYYHLRKGSVAVTVNQTVKAGTQLGLAASSGNSTGPHLHFESRNNGSAFEPAAGNCRSGIGSWVNQIPIRRDLWIEDFAVHNANAFPAGSFLPYNPVRAGTIVRTGGFQSIGAWYIIHNQPAFSTWQVRYLRPNGTVFYASPANSHNNPTSYRYASWWFYYNLAPDISGTWTMELSVNGQVVVQAPFLVLNTGGTPTNRPPQSIAAAVFEPSVPTTHDAVFLRVTLPLLADPDYDLVRVRYRWFINGVLYRDVTTAAQSDALPSGVAAPGDTIQCIATPFDGALYSSDTSTTVVTLSPPTIGTQPLSQLVSVGQSATFTVVATPTTPPLTYQWRKEGTDLDGATGATLTIANAQSAAAGAYTVVVSNRAGSVTSPPATLTFRVPGGHTADTTPGDGRIDLVELLRVIELYNTRHGTIRTGRYAVATTATADGFIPDPATPFTTAVALERYHSADTIPRDGRIHLPELTRVIELFNTRSGATRTGAYHVQTGTEDGFAPGP